MRPHPIAPLVLAASAAVLVTGSLQAQGPPGRRGGGGRFAEMEKRAVAEPFVGLTTDGEVQEGLYQVGSPGASTAAVREAATAFLASLSPEQRARTTFAVDDSEWRRWANQHSLPRQGVSFAEMDAAQREAAFALLAAGLSERGLETAKNIMKLNETLAEMSGKPGEYGRWLYHLTVMGEPSETGPWGWQFDGHHGVINYFVLGDQVVMTPTFLGSEPVHATSGKYEGTVILQEEQDAGLAFVNLLTDSQKTEAILAGEKPGTNAQGEAFKDNIVVPYAGVAGAALDGEQKKQLLALTGMWLGHMDPAHAAVKLEDVAAHLDETRFAWVGGTGPDDVFYYRIQSPVIFIEFDHQRPIGLERTGVATRDHIHAVIRTPNGNDYGKALLDAHRVGER